MASNQEHVTMYMERQTGGKKKKRQETERHRHKESNRREKEKGLNKDPQREMRKGRRSHEGGRGRKER